MMTSLTTEHYELLNMYTNLLQTVEEGFDYVIKSFTNYELTEGDVIFKDILAAFYHLDASHQTLYTVLKEEQAILEKLRKFEEIILTFDNHSTIFQSLENHHEYVQQTLAPAFLSWKDSIQDLLKPYIAN